MTRHLHAIDGGKSVPAHIAELQQRCAANKREILRNPQQWLPVFAKLDAAKARVKATETQRPPCKPLAQARRVEIVRDEA
jgi:hypothetical protein